MKLTQKPQKTQYQVCRVCGYDRNQDTATHCEACKLSLKRPTIKAALADLPTLLLRSRSQVTTIALLFVLIAAGISYFRSHQAGQDNDVPSLAENSSSSTKVKGQQLLADSADFQSRYIWMREVPHVPIGTFNYGGATCFAAMTTHGINAAITTAYPQFNLRYTELLNDPPGCSTGIQMLLDGQLSFAQNGRSLSDEEYNEAKKRNFYLQQIPVAIDGIAFFTHPAIKVPGLSVAQLQDIYTGKVKNWKQLGGQDLPIVPISQDIEVHSSLKLLLGKQVKNLSNNVKIVRDYTSAMRLVASKPGAISYSSAAIAQGQKTIRTLALAKNSKYYVSPFTNNQVNVAALRDGTYPITRRLFVVIRRDGTFDQKAGVAYANLLSSVEGQRIIEKSGFAAIYLGKSE